MCVINMRKSVKLTVIQLSFIGGGTGGGQGAPAPSRVEGGPPPQCLTFIGINTFDQIRPPR